MIKIINAVFVVIATPVRYRWDTDTGATDEAVKLATLFLIDFLGSSLLMPFFVAIAMPVRYR